MKKLDGKKIQKLKSDAHHLNPVVHVGKNGLTEALIDSVDDALNCHELVKMKFNDFKSAKKELSSQIADRVNAIVVSIIGNVAILYRMHEDQQKRKFFKS